MAKAIDFGLFLIFGTKWEASQEDAQWGRWQIVGPLVMNDDGNRGVRQNATKNENVGVTEWQVSWDSQTLTRKILDYNDLITNLFTILKRRKEKAVVFIWGYAYYLVHLSKQRACKASHFLLLTLHRVPRSPFSSSKHQKEARENRFAALEIRDEARVLS